MEIPIVPIWLGVFKGAGHSYLDCEVLAIRHLDPWQLDQHWEAQDTIWFDYVRMHPVKAFYYFCHCYSQAYGDYLYSNIDMGLRYSKGMSGDPILHRDKRSMFTLKAQADKHGVPYEIWLAGLFEWFALNGWTRPPRPAHLANSTEAQEHALSKWATIVSEMTVYPKDPWFSTCQYVGHPQQRRAEDWIVDSMRRRANKDIATASAVYTVDALRIERACLEFGQFVLDAQAHQKLMR